jgi:hypothetical protein
MLEPSGYSHNTQVRLADDVRVKSEYKYTFRNLSSTSRMRRINFCTTVVCGLGVDSAFNINEYQEFSLGGGRG